MSDAERMEQFRLIILRAMLLFRETRKEISKLQAHYLGMRMFLLSVNPAIESPLTKELDGFVQEAQNKLDDQTLGVETELERSLDEVIGLLELQDPKKKAN